MRGLATRAEVHPNTLVRLAQAIGFDGYESMRERFRDFVVAGGLGSFRDRARWLQEMEARGGTSEVMAEMAGAAGQNCETMWRGQDAVAVDAIPDAILVAPRVYVLGMGSAYSLANQFWYVAQMAFDHIVPIPRHGSQPVDDLAWATPHDVLVALTFQPYRAETMRAARRAQKMGATVIGVTDRLTAPLAMLSDHLLITPTHTPQFFQSHAAATALLETLVAVLVARQATRPRRKSRPFTRNEWPTASTRNQHRSRNSAEEGDPRPCLPTSR